MTKTTESAPSSKTIVIGVILILIAGVVSGFLLTKGSGTPKATKMATGEGTVMTAGGEVEKVVGIEDVDGLDEAEGELVEGGINGEGSHHLERPGGPSQSVYLVSSMIDLDQYIGQTVRVWGETNDAQAAGWFMDVVKLEVVE